MTDSPRAKLRRSNTNRQVLEGSLRGQGLELVQDARLAPILVDEEDALGGALLTTATVFGFTSRDVT